MLWYDMLINYILPALTIVVTVITGFIKNKKLKTYGLHLLMIIDKAKELIVEAETHTHYTGAEKKNYVMSRLIKFLVNNNIKNISEEDCSDIVESEVELTNKVNLEKKSILSTPNT